MSSGGGHGEKSQIVEGELQHSPPEKESPIAKRQHIDDEAEKSESSGGHRFDVSNGVEIEPDISEANVGIVAYINDHLRPIKGGNIKQRFSDFHVREVSEDGKINCITSIYPPKKEQGGSGLYEFMKQQEAESNDSSGELLKKRREREATARAAKEEEAKKEEEKVYSWQVSEANEERLSTLLGQEALTELKKLYEQGPQGWKPSESNHSNITNDAIANAGGSRGGRSGRGGREGRAGKDARKKADPRCVQSRALSSKEERTAVHQLIRETFEGSFTTDTCETLDENNSGEKISKIRIRWMSKDPKRLQLDQRGTRSQDEPPPYVHFLMQKSNRENQDAMNMIARSLGLIKPGVGGSKALRDLSVAGTKDKRAVTVQKVAFRRGRKEIDDIWKMLNGVGKSSEVGGRGNRGGFRGGRNGSSGGKPKSPMDAIRGRGERGIRIGHLEYSDKPLHLGMLQGNEFEIVLRDVHVESFETLEETVNVLKERGFVNYYGMQRFGTSTISTHTIGLALFRNDFKNAVELIMTLRPGDPEEVQEARKAFEKGDLEKSLRLFPFYHIPERAVLQRMQADKTGKKDWQSYFMAIPRSLRTMYVHAYQSYIWNRMVTERIKRFGLDSPVIGDLVLMENVKDEDAAIEEQEIGTEYDEEAEYNAGEAKSKIILGKRVKELRTVEEALQYSIHDVVMPLPGNQIQMSQNGWMAQVYLDMLAQDGLEPENIGNSNTPEFALTGDYRKILHLPRNVNYHLLRYSNVNANLCQSDEDKILGLDVPEAQEYKLGEGDSLEEGEYVAMIIRLTLGSSAYATMALRELLKQDTSVAHQKEMSERSERHRKEKSQPYRNNDKVNRIVGKQVRTWGAIPKEEEAKTES